MAGDFDYQVEARVIQALGDQALSEPGSERAAEGEILQQLAQFEAAHKGQVPALINQADKNNSSFVSLPWLTLKASENDPTHIGTVVIEQSNGRNHRTYQYEAIDVGEQVAMKTRMIDGASPFARSATMINLKP